MTTFVQNSITGEDYGVVQMPVAPRAGERLRISTDRGDKKFLVEEIEYSLSGAGFHIYLYVRPLDNRA